ncbi:MAG: hypothetical protein K1Y36_13370 [Blastocatellia bacterium]|nr:hypothetical protein [Blastocatellia bacterium]
MIEGWFSWIIEWLLAILRGFQGRLIFGFLVFYVLYTLFTFWSYRFAIKATGVREATYSQAITIRVIDLLLTGLLFLFGFLFPWGIPLVFLVRVLTFKVFFKAEFGKALLGVLLSTLMGATFTLIYVLGVIVWTIIFKRPPF